MYQTPPCPRVEARNASQDTICRVQPPAMTMNQPGTIQPKSEIEVS